MLKSIKSKSAKGKSFVFTIEIIVEYISGITAKIIGNQIAYVFWLYILNIVMVITDLIVMIGNYRREKNKRVRERKLMKTELWCILDILLAAALGFLIGLERKFRSKEAGIRTHTIVCLASALFMVISKYAFGTGDDFDPARIAAQIIPGIGFLGAGMIVYKKNIVHGLTTAAGVWATAGVGMACGGKLYIVAVATTMLLIAFQFILHTKKGIFSSKKSYRLNISFSLEENEDTIVKDLFEVEHFYRFHVNRIGGKVVCEVTLFTESGYTSEQLNAYVKKYPFIISIQRVDEE